MTQTFIGKRFKQSNKEYIVAVGVVHQMSKKSFQWEGFEQAIVLSWPINNQEWWKKRSEAFKGSFGKKNKGRVSTLNSARVAILAYCPPPTSTAHLMPMLHTSMGNDPLDRILAHGQAQHNLPIDRMLDREIATMAAMSLVAAKVLKR